MAQFLWFLSGLFLTAQGPFPPKYRYVEIRYQSLQQVRDLVSAGWDVAGVDIHRKTATLVMQEGSAKRTLSMPVVSWRNLYAPDSQYKTPVEVEDILFDYENRFPHLVAIHKIGKSVEGRDIYAAEVTARFVLFKPGPKPAAVIDSLHHAREVMTPEVTLDMLDQLASQYQVDPEVTDWLNNYAIWIVPMVNPDGSQKVWTSSSMWRKNTRGGYGVDVNRNYPYQWNSCNGSSGNRNDETYRGSAPGSEPETQALMSLISSVKPKINLSYHSFSEIVIYPYGCSPTRVAQPDRANYESIGKELARKLVRDSGSGTYTAGTSYDLLYDVDGGSIDWMYNAHKTFSYVVEVNSTAQGFQPSYNRWRDDTVKRQRAGWRYMLSKMATL
jgi:carboxypeptidase T